MPLGKSSWRRPLKERKGKIRRRERKTGEGSGGERKGKEEKERVDLYSDRSHVPIIEFLGRNQNSIMVILIFN